MHTDTAVKERFNYWGEFRIAFIWGFVFGWTAQVKETDINWLIPDAGDVGDEATGTNTTEETDKSRGQVQKNGEEGFKFKFFIVPCGGHIPKKQEADQITKLSEREHIWTAI